jgi:hypothetical protein
MLGKCQTFIVNAHNPIVEDTKMDAQKALRELSKPHADGEKIQSIIDRTSRLAGLSYSRCYEIYYGRVRRIDPDELARISDALDQKNQRDARSEFQELWVRVARLESYFAQKDADFHREDLAALRQAVNPGGPRLSRLR